MLTKMKNMRALLLALCAIVSLDLSAQTITVTGNVKDTTGEPIIGASVVQKGVSGNGSITDLDGNYRLSVPSNATILISYMGMKPKEITVNGKSKIDVTLEDDAHLLDEVVAIGYATMKKKDFTGAVTSVGFETLAKVPVANAAQALTGRLSGVQITTADGSPDAEVLIRVRGGGSVTSDNSPLIIVDGFPVSSINDVAPTDIETIDVLKDASSTAIYGAQGANGVILITTKGAKVGKTVVSYNGFLQSKNIARKMDVLSPYEYALFNYERALLDGTESLEKFTERYGVWDDLALYKYQKGIDWQDDLFGSNTLSQQHNISINGGSEKTQFNLSGTYNYDGGLMENNDYSRLNVTFNLKHEIAKGLRLDMIARVSDAEANGSGTSGGTYKVRSTAGITTSPVKSLLDQAVVDPNSMTEEEYEEWLNSRLTLSERAQQYWKRKNDRTFNFSGGLNWDIIKGLRYRIEGNYQYKFSETKNYYGPLTSQSSNEGQNLPLVDWTKENNRSYRVANTLFYNKTIDAHYFDVLLGQEIRVSGRDNSYIKAKFFDKDLSPEKIFANIGLSSGTNNLTNTSFVSPEDRTLSFFGRANYRLLDRYMFTFTLRADGSSKFARGNRWGYFPAAALAWRISEEPFMESVKDYLSNLKLRFSYGTAGNNRIGNTLYKQDYKIGTPSGSSRPIGANEVPSSFYITTSSQLANPDLKWETTITRNAGLDFGFLNDRFSGTLDAYWNTTKDLLISSSIIAPGYSTQQRNVGQTSNRGFEMTLNAYILEKKDYSLSATFNFGMNRSKVDKLSEGITSQSYSSGWGSSDLKGSDDFRVIVGQPIGLIYGFITDGYYTTDDFEKYDESTKKWIPKSQTVTNSYVTMRPGALKLKDLPDENGNYDGVVNESDRQVIGKTNPKHFGGFGLNGTFYGFDASIFFNWVYGNKIYNADKIATSQQYRSSYPNVQEFMNSSNRYTYIDAAGQLITDMETLKKMNEGENTKQYWSPHNFGNAVVVPHSWAIEDGSFLRLQNITVGYTLPSRLTRKFACTQLRFYCTLNNVWTWTNYTGYDPEVSTAIRGSSTSGLTPGVDYSSYPKSFSTTFGVNISF